MSTTERPEERLLTASEVGQMLLVSESTLAKWRMADRRYGPRFVRIGGKVAYLESDVRRWLASKIVQDVPEAGEVNHG